MDFYSLHIWNTADDKDDDWNPGNYETLVGGKILDAVVAAEFATKKDSPEREDFEWRTEFISNAVERMDNTDEHTWWDAQYPVLMGLKGNKTVMRERDEGIRLTSIDASS